MFEHLRDIPLLGWMIRNLHLALFVGTYIEGLGIPLPAELLYGVTGLKVQAGHMRFSTVVAMGTAGNVLGSLTSYGAAYWGGRAALKRLNALGNVAGSAEEKAQAFFSRWGPLTITIGRFVGVIRVASILGAGLTRLSPWRFVAFLTVGALAWNWLWAYVGLVFGHAMEPIMKRAGRWVLLLFFALLVAMIVRAVWRWWKRRQGDSEL